MVGIDEPIIQWVVGEALVTVLCVRHALPSARLCRGACISHSPVCCAAVEEDGCARGGGGGGSDISFVFLYYQITDPYKMERLS